MSDKATNRWGWGIFSFFIVIFIALKGYTVFPFDSDENIYYYAGYMTSQGLMPYQDYFFAHPPLQIYLFAIYFYLVGIDFEMVRILPIVVVLCTILVSFGLIKRTLGFGAALSSMFLMMFSYGLLRHSSFAYGISLTLLFVVIAADQLFRERAKTAGILSAMALLTRFHAIPLLTAIGVFLLLFRRDLFKRWLTSSLAVWVPANLLLWGLYGDKFIDGVWRYHFNKPETSLKASGIVDFALHTDFYLYYFFGIGVVIVAVGALVALVIWRKRGMPWTLTGLAKYTGPQPQAGLALIGGAAISIVVCLSFFFSMKRIFIYYSIVLYPFLAPTWRYYMLRV